MRILILGASGQVGKRLKTRLEANHEVVGTGHSHPDGLERLDLADPKAVESLVERVRPDVILNPAGITNVEWCEEHPDEAMAVNGEGPAAAARAAKRIGAYLLHFSTDYVFDGVDAPYFEEDEPNPVCAYARSKREGERRVEAEAGSWAIVRTAVVYSWEKGGKNFLMQILQAAEEGKVYPAFTDHENNPTQADNLADAVVEFAERRIEGLYHVAGPHTISRYKFATEALANFRLPPGTVRPTKMAEVPMRAARPATLGLKIGKAQAILKTRMLWPTQALQVCMEAKIREEGTLLGGS